MFSEPILSPEDRSDCFELLFWVHLFPGLFSVTAFFFFFFCSPKKTATFGRDGPADRKRPEGPCSLQESPKTLSPYQPGREQPDSEWRISERRSTRNTAFDLSAFEMREKRGKSSRSRTELQIFHQHHITEIKQKPPFFTLHSLQLLKSNTIARPARRESRASDARIQFN